MLTLPYPPRRSHLFVFWAILGGVSALLVVGVALVLWGFGPTSFLIGVAVLVGLLIGFVWTQIALLAYRVWNRLEKIIGMFAFSWIVALIHFLILPTSRLIQSRATRDQDTRRGWIRMPVDPDPDTQRESLAWEESSWLLRLIRAAPGHGRAFWLALAPHLLLLSLFRSEVRDRTPPSGTYTLF